MCGMTYLETLSGLDTEDVCGEAMTSVLDEVVPDVFDQLLACLFDAL